MRALALPYPVSVGRDRRRRVVELGARPASTFEGRLGVPRRAADLAAARAAFEAALDDGEAPPVEIAWTGGAFAPGETPPEHPWVAARRAPRCAAERGDRAGLAGVP